MYIDHEDLEYELLIKNVNDNIIPTVRVRSYEDPDLSIGGKFTLKGRVLPIKYQGHNLPIAADLVFTNDTDEPKVINVEVTLIDAEDVVQSLRNLT